MGRWGRLEASPTESRARTRALEFMATTAYASAISRSRAGEYPAICQNLRVFSLHVRYYGRNMQRHRRLGMDSGQTIFRALTTMPLPNDSEALRDKELRMAQFHEAAKTIAFWQREAPKRHMRFDLIKEIKRVQQEAYELGFAHASLPPAIASQMSQPNHPIAWLLLPVRARDAFDQICRFNWTVLLASPREGSATANQNRCWLCYWDRGEEVQSAERFVFERNFSASTVRPLLERELVRRVDYAGHHAYLEVTERGWDTFDLAIADGKIAPVRD